MTENTPRRRLIGKVAIITGAASGIGRAAAELFASEGARVILADIAESGEDVASRIRQNDGDARFVRTDVTDPESVKACIDVALQHYSRLNVLYNNAGGSTLSDGPVTACPDTEFWRTIKVDLYGTWLFCKYGIPEIVKAGGGSIINMTSTCVIRGISGMDAYTASKGGVASLTQAMAKGFASQNVRVNALAPGATLSDRLKSFLDKSDTIRANIKNNQPLGLGEPIDLAYAALYLASDESRITTGQIITVDGGLTL